MVEHILSLISVSKSYSGKKILNKVDLDVKNGEIHSIVGKNGVGKSVLMKCLLNLENIDSGEIKIFDQKLHSKGNKNKIFGIFQKPKLIFNLTTIENVYLGSEWAVNNRWLSVVNWTNIEREITEILSSFDCSLNLRKEVKSLSIFQQKIVEIVKAICSGARVLILDEPTADLDSQDSDNYIDIVKRLDKYGITVLFVSHRLTEIMKVSDRVSIMREGKIVKTQLIQSCNIETIIDDMIQESTFNPYPKLTSINTGKEVLRVEGLSNKRIFKNVSFILRQCEIVGLTGFSDSGIHSVGDALCGNSSGVSGSIFVNQKKLNLNDLKHSLKSGISFIPSNRSNNLVDILGLDQNITLANLKTVSDNVFIDLELERKITEEYVSSLGINPKEPKEKVRNLSAGNQQKVMIAKSLLSRSQIYVISEPTKGLDISSKVEVYNLLNNIILRNGTVLLISSDINELIGMCDRLLIMNRGEIHKELIGKEMTEKKILFNASEKGRKN